MSGKKWACSVFFPEPQPILCKDNALCHNSNFLSPQIFITATYRTISTRFVSLKVVKFKQKPAWNLVQSQEKQNMSKPCTMKRWQRWLAIVAERRHSAITRYASATERAGIRHAPCNQRAGGTLLPERIPTPAAMPTRRILRQRLDNNSNRDPRTSPGASVYW